MLVSAVGRLMSAVMVHWPPPVAGSGVSASVTGAEAVTEAVTPPEVFDGVPAVQLTVQLIEISSVPLALNFTDTAAGAGTVPLSGQA